MTYFNLECRGHCHLYKIILNNPKQTNKQELLMFLRVCFRTARPKSTNALKTLGYKGDITSKQWCLETCN